MHSKTSDKTGAMMSTHMVCIHFSELIAQLGLAWHFQTFTWRSATLRGFNTLGSKILSEAS